ncbi:hypothetical protein MIR68_000997 [Amoeboaphelidium protococcarum]|nr:hypothetical protein MIR68_000997 [Amoeboaphelidium protococcarum]
MTLSKPTVLLKNDKEATLSIWYSLSEQQWSASYGDLGRDIYKIFCSSAQFPLKSNVDVLNGLIGLDVEGEQAYRQYRNVADALIRDPVQNRKIDAVCQLVQQTIAFCRDNPYSRVPFIFVDGSSGIGKTQLAFCLLQKCRGQQSVGSSNTPICYLLPTGQDEYSQPIYR